MYEVGGGLLEGYYGEEGKLFILGDLDGTAGNDLVTQGLVVFVKIFHAHVRDSDQVGIEVIRVPNDEAGVDHSSEGFGG